jgi:hypothetical protein
MTKRVESLLESANEKMETLVQSYNELVKKSQTIQGELQESQTSIVKHQGYLEALKDIDEK